MHIDITIIDKYLIDKNKQFLQHDEIAYTFYVIALLLEIKKVGV